MLSEMFYTIKRLNLLFIIVKMNDKESCSNLLGKFLLKQNIFIKTDNQNMIRKFVSGYTKNIDRNSNVDFSLCLYCFTNNDLYVLSDLYVLRCRNMLVYKGF
ncbi:hypothetical protein bcgnr5414_59480 [Bacillus cereus]